ncbi:MAG: ABC transporter ATP-binding protein [Thermoproteota archaeon]
MEKYSGWRVFIRLMGYVARRRKLLAAGVASVIAMAYTSGVVPVLVRDAVDRGVVAGNVREAAYFAALIIAATALSGLFSFAGRYVLTKLAQEAVYEVRMEAFTSIQRQSMDFFDNTLVGQLISRVTNDAERVARFLSFRLRMLIYSLFLIAVSMYYMYTMSPRLTAIAAATIVASVALSFRYGESVRPIYDKVRHQTGVLAGIAAATLAGIKSVKAMALEDRMYSSFAEENRRFYDYSLQASRLTAIYGNAPILVTGVAMAGMLYYGAMAIVAGTLTVGVLVAFLTYMLTLMWPLTALGFSIGDIERAIAASKRLFDIIDAQPKVAEKPDAINLKDVRGEVVFENVTFSYQPGKPVLRDVTFKVRPGEKVVIVGPPGSGKSTVLKLLLRLYDPDSGRILIDGIDIRDVSLSSLRRHIGYVPQEPFIFNRSIRENIALGNPGATLREIVEAAKIAKIHDFIASLPRGYETPVGERGVSLSGGQRQRIAIARALVGNPKILLLDDPVSNLDAETEKALVEDLREILKGRTVIIVTQRPSLISLADRVLVMDRGRIVEEGTHAELLEKGGLYYRIYRSMLGENGG